MPEQTQALTPAEPPRSEPEEAGAPRPPGRAPVVSLRGVTRAYGDSIAVRDVDLDVEEREFFTLLGPSGSGKTTILRIIAGLVEPTSGHVSIGGRDVRGLPPYERDIAVVFQSLALFPHMSVFSNVAFPLRMRRVGRRDVAAKVSAALETVRLGPRFEERAISQLSGGERQRVALARALVCEPKILLLDEPLAALDRRLREDMQLELVRLHHEIEVTILNVTHDQREALMLSDRIGVMNNGSLVQVGPSERMYNQPKTRFVAAFIGDATLLDARLEREHGETVLEVDTYDMHRLWTGQDFGGKLPSEVFREHFLTCFISDPVGVQLRNMIGIDNIAWECDYPHSDSSWPQAPEELAAVARDVPAEELNKITYQNAMRWYSFDPFAYRAKERSTVGALRAEAGDHDVSIKSSDKHRFEKSVGVSIGKLAARPPPDPASGRLELA